MDIEAVTEVARANMEKRRFQLEREPGYVYAHGMRVANLAGEILSRVTSRDSAVDPILYTGALFHDIGKGFASHNDAGADITRSLLKDFCSNEELDAIEGIVRFHCVRKQGLDLDDRILAVQDADIIDHLGTQVVWLNFLHAGFHDGSAQSVVDWWEGETYKGHVAEMRRLINLDLSRAIMEERIAFHEDFLARFKAETEGRLPVTINEVSASNPR